jgi:hypothetical protein
MTEEKPLTTDSMVEIPAEAPVRPEDKIPLREKLAYGAMDIFGGGQGSLLSLLLMYFFTSVVGVNPGFAGQKLVPSTLSKITRMREYLDSHGYPDIEIEVDGNVSFENAKKMTEAGADIFVAGTSSIYAKGGDMFENAQKLRDIINGK